MCVTMFSGSSLTFVTLTETYAHMQAFTCTHTHTHTHIDQESPTSPLYTEIMGKGKPKGEEGDDGSQPEVPQKQLTQEDLRELNLPTDEEVPSVPQQNLTTEDIQQMSLSTEVFMFTASFLAVNKEEKLLSQN